jgi:hypothetical protein
MCMDVLIILPLLNWSRPPGHLIFSPKYGRKYEMLNVGLTPKSAGSSSI